jgi:pyochelin synthetase
LDWRNGMKNALAVIGMNCRFPGANNVEELCKVLSEGNAPFTQIQSPNPSNEIPINISIRDADKFDADFFGYTVREAEIIDPQQRCFLQMGWELLELSGYNPRAYSGLIGIFAGASTSTYLINHLLSNPILKSIGELQAAIYNDKDYLTSLLAYHLNLKGPTVTVQTSCSTSLVAIHMACESLLSGQCDMAMAGGITLMFPEAHSYSYQEGGLVSKNGKVCSFDAEATGTVYSNGAGIVLLKRLEDAQRDNDSIITVIKGTAINNDGANRIGFFAPGVEGQTAVISEALSMAKIPLNTVGYIEAHGSGTPLGDAIEWEAIQRANNMAIDSSKCAVGSIKCNIGHTQAAAGIAGFIKACLSLNKKVLFPSPNYNRLNPNCKQDDRLYVPTALTSWKKSNFPRRACVNSFGLGGTNAHVVLEEYDQEVQTDQEFYPDIFILSAKTEDSLRILGRSYIEFLESHLEKNINDIAFTTRVGRIAMPFRLAVHFSSRADLIQQIKNKCASQCIEKVNIPSNVNVVIEGNPSFTSSDMSILLKEYPVLNSLQTEFELALRQASSESAQAYLVSATLVKILNRLNLSAKSWLYSGTNGQKFAPYFDNQSSLVDQFKRFADECLSNSFECFKSSNLIEDSWENPQNAINLSLSTQQNNHLSPGRRFLDWIEQMWMGGASIDWSIIERRSDLKRVKLPTYPFKRKRFLIEQKSPSTHTSQSNSGTTIEIKKLWEEVMGVEDSSLSDNFFELGGHSFLVTQLLFSIEKKFQKKLSLQDFLNNPTLGGLIELIEKEEGLNSHCTLPGIFSEPSNRFEPFSLTDIQQAYWVGRNTNLDLGSISTHMYIEKDIVNLDIQRFEQALNRTILNHDMLRAIILKNGFQKVLPKIEDYAIKIHDLQSLSQSEQSKKLEEIRHEMSHELFELDQWPLFKFVATKINEKNTRLHISIDLLIVDAWSIELWLKEIGNFYINPEQTIHLPQVTFRDYVQSLKVIEKSDLYERSKSYWTKRVNEGFLSAPTLPLVQDPAKLQNPNFKRFQDFLSKQEWSAIREKCKLLNVTSPVVLMGAFSEVLRLWSSTKDFCLNLTMFNRLPLHADVNLILGDFTTLTLLEIRSKSDLTFAERLSLIQKQLWTDLEYRHFSGPRITRELIKISPDQSIVFPIIFTSLLNQNEDDAPSPFQLMEDPLAIESYSVSQTPQVWLDHQVMEREGELHFNWDVVIDLFPKGLIEAMFITYKKLLVELASNNSIWGTQQPLRSFSYLNHLFPSGTLQIENDSGITAIDITPHPSTKKSKSLIEDFFKRAQLEPEKIAVIYSDLMLSYNDVAIMSQNIARMLSQKNIQPGDLVGIVMHKGWEMLAAMIAVLRTGGAFLPIEASLPPLRINEMLMISGVKLVIVDEEIHENKLSLSDYILFDKKSFKEPLKEEFSPLYFDEDQTAYAFFTSGSTGQPKCVEVSHKAALNTIQSVINQFDICQHDTVLNLSNFSFDLSIFDIFGLLSVGGKIVIPCNNDSKDPKAWQKLIQQHQVTIWNSTPAFMQMLSDYISNQEIGQFFSTLRLVMLSGDKIPVSLALALKNKYHIPRVISLGGATEAAIWSIWYEITGCEDSNKNIPYGTAMPQQQVLVLNNGLEECPIWIEGDIYIRGTGLAKGYRNNPEITSRSFIDHSQLGRIYRTGDRGKYRNDHIIEFLGRKDTQIKLRGHRIELGEIESKINQHEWVKGSVVTAEPSKDGILQLVAFIELNPAIANQYIDIPEGVITNPTERLKFKLSDPGLRKELSREPIELGSSLIEDSIEKFLHRKSSRHFLKENLDLVHLAKFLSNLKSVNIKGLPFGKRLYGSGGGLYPVQVYLHAKKVSGLAKGIYYYHPKNHSLCIVNQNSDIQSLHFPMNNRKIVEDSAFEIYLIADFGAIVPMYGLEEGQKLIYLEAGLISQLLETEAPKSGVGLCQVGGLNFAKIQEQFNLNKTCQFIHCLVGGPIAKEQLSVEGVINDFDLYHAGEKNVQAELMPPMQEPVTVIRNFLADLLPEYMVPQYIHIVPSFPLSSNGKIDRKACSTSAFNSKVNKVALNTAPLIPSESIFENKSINTDLEKQLIIIWASVLKNPNLSSTDNFFDVGGDSVSLVHVYRDIQSQITQKISMMDLFKYPTIRSLSNFLSEGKVTTEMSIKDETRSSARKAIFEKKKAHTVT